MSEPTPPVDPGNHLLAELPAQMMTALMQTPGGQRMALTIRTPTTTLTVLLQQGDARTWATNINATASQMSGAGLIVAGPNGVNGALGEHT